MAKPILGPPILTGKAAEWLKRYVATAVPDPAKQKEYEEGIKTFKWPSK